MNRRVIRARRPDTFRVETVMQAVQAMGRIEFQLGRNLPLVSGQLLTCEPDRLLVSMNGEGTSSPPKGSVHFAYIADGTVYLGAGTATLHTEGTVEVILTTPARAYNRRNGPRRDCNIEISARPIRESGGAAPWQVSKFENISVGGCAFHLNCPVENNSLMEVRFAMPVILPRRQGDEGTTSKRLDGEGEGQRIRTSVRVARCRQIPEGGYMAHAEFRNLAQDAALCLAWYTLPLYPS